jgi:hypothetical protein
MKKYNINKMLDEWGGSSIGSQNPFPAGDDEPEDVEDLTATNDAGAASVDLTTNIPGPANPENRPGSDRKKLNIKEAADELVPNPPKPKPKPATPPSVPPNVATGTDPAMMGGAPGDMSGMDPNMDPSMMGMGMQTGPTDAVEVGRVYELKKIYSRLVSMQSYLSASTDVNLIKLRNYVSNTMDLFRTLISNIALYKDRIDEIIVTFYKVVDNVYVILSKYYKDNTTGNDIMVKAIE